MKTIDNILKKTKKIGTGLLIGVSLYACNLPKFEPYGIKFERPVDVGIFYSDSTYYPTDSTTCYFKDLDNDGRADVKLTYGLKYESDKQYELPWITIKKGYEEKFGISIVDSL